MVDFVKGRIVWLILITTCLAPSWLQAGLVMEVDSSSEYLTFFGQDQINLDGGLSFKWQLADSVTGLVVSDVTDLFSVDSGGVERRTTRLITQDLGLTLFFSFVTPVDGAVVVTANGAGISYQDFPEITKTRLESLASASADIDLVRGSGGSPLAIRSAHAAVPEPGTSVVYWLLTAFCASRIGRRNGVCS